MGRKKIRVTCVYCETWYNMKHKNVGVNECPVSGEFIHQNSAICDKFSPHNYIYCVSGRGKNYKQKRIHIDVCVNYQNNKEYGCGSCGTGKIVSKIKETPKQKKQKTIL